MTVRDKTHESEFLAAAQRAAGQPDSMWHQLVDARLEQHGREHGDTFAARSLGDLLTEVAEEALDLVGWAALISTSLEFADLSDRDRARFAASLQAIAALGVQAFELTQRALAAAEARA